MCFSALLPIKQKLVEWNKCSSWSTIPAELSCVINSHPEVPFPQIWAVWDTSWAVCHCCGVMGPGLDHSWVDGAPRRWMRRALLVQFQEVKSFGGSLENLDSKTSLCTALRVTIAARLCLKGMGGAVLEGAHYSYCPGITQAPQEVAFEHVAFPINQHRHLENIFVFMKLLLISWCFLGALAVQFLVWFFH